MSGASPSRGLNDSPASGPKASIVWSMGLAARALVAVTTDRREEEVASARGSSQGRPERYPIQVAGG